jgi:hypothetical protein
MIARLFLIHENGINASMKLFYAKGAELKIKLPI